MTKLEIFCQNLIPTYLQYVLQYDPHASSYLVQSVASQRYTSRFSIEKSKVVHQLSRKAQTLRRCGPLLSFEDQRRLVVSIAQLQSCQKGCRNGMRHGCDPFPVEAGMDLTVEEEAVAEVGGEEAAVGAGVVAVEEVIKESGRIGMTRQRNTR